MPSDCFLKRCGSTYRVEFPRSIPSDPAGHTNDQGKDM
jgi:hypothetical protein